MTLSKSSDCLRASSPPLTIAILALLLYLNFRSVAEVAIVLSSLPFALVGGVWLMWAAGYNLSVAVAAGARRTTYRRWLNGAGGSARTGNAGMSRLT